MLLASGIKLHPLLARALTEQGQVGKDGVKSVIPSQLGISQLVCRCSLSRIKVGQTRTAKGCFLSDSVLLRGVQTSEVWKWGFLIRTTPV